MPHQQKSEFATEYYRRHREEILAKLAAKRRAKGVKEQLGLTVGTNRALYQTWQHIKDRCFNPRCALYPRYGGRGIRIATEWINDPAAFIAHVGSRPSPRHSIDRIDNDGHYEPGNVRWATYEEQNRNRRAFCTPRKLTAESIEMICKLLIGGVLQKDIAAQFGVTRACISEIKRGKSWSTRVPNSIRRLLPPGKLTPKDVRAIRRLLRDGKTQVEIGARFGVGQSMISRIKLGWSWRK